MRGQNDLQAPLLRQFRQSASQDTGLRWVQEGLRLVDENYRRSSRQHRNQQTEQAAHPVALVDESGESSQGGAIVRTDLINARGLDRRYAHTQDRLRLQVVGSDRHAKAVTDSRDNVSTASFESSIR